MLKSPIASADQAASLRHFRGNDPAPSENAPTRVLSVTSGKGGVGKTSVVSNLALFLARRQKKVLIIDADLGLSNIDVLYGLAPRYNLNHFFHHELPLADVLTEGPDGIRILPAASGVQELTHLDDGQKKRFARALEDLPERFEFVLIDTEAGISENVTWFNSASHNVLVVTTPDPTAITDAYALMKLLSSRYGRRSFQLIVNWIRNDDEGLEVFHKLTMVSNRYLDISIDYLGGLPYDKRMRESVQRQKSPLDLFPGGRISRAFNVLGKNLWSIPVSVFPKDDLHFF